MGQLVLGAAGAFVGGMFGGPLGASIGWALGSMAWNLLDPPKVQGPRMNDTKIRGADYGQMRTILYGMCRIGGIGMGQGSTENGPNEFTEHEEKSSGKGGPEVTNYRYTLSFANEICEGPHPDGIIGVWRRWANARLVTEPGVSASDIWPYTLYLGDVTQMPDPTLQQIYNPTGSPGSNEVNPMRGVAYEVIEELDMTDYGNSRPNVEYEAYTKGGSYPWRYSTFTWKENPALFGQTIEFDENTQLITTVETNIFGYFIKKQWQLDGTQVGGDVEYFGAGTIFRGIANRNLYAIQATGTDAYWRHIDDIGTAGSDIFDISPPPNRINGFSPLIMGDYAYGAGGTVAGVMTVARYPLRVQTETGKLVPMGEADVYYSLDKNYPITDVNIGASDTGDLYIYATTGLDVDATFWKFTSELGLVHTWTFADMSGTYVLDLQGMFHVYKNKIVFGCDPPGTPFVAVVHIASDFTLTNHTHSLTQTAEWPVVHLTGSLFMDAEGVFSVDPPPAKILLSEIVADLFERAGLTAGEYDVTDLATQEVRGFVVGSQMTVRNALDILRKGFFFDIGEWDGKLVCRFRGHSATDTIPDGDLCAHTPGSEPPEPLQVVRVSELELPRTVNINFYNYDNDYQTGTQYWRRTVTRSESDVTLDLPIVFTAGEAMQLAQWHMHFAWLERDRFTFYVTQAWQKLRPTNVVVVRGVNIRITNVTESPDGIIKCEGVRGFAGAFTGTNITDPIDGETPGTGGGGQPPQEPPVGKADTSMILIDGPLISEADGITSVRAAIYKSGTGSWSAAGVYKSSDGGTSYTSIASTSSQTIVGTVPVAIGDFLGGNVIDESNYIDVTLNDSSATLVTATEEGLLNGANLFAYGTAATGWEFGQFRTATLQSPGVWRLTGLLRWRLGTYSAKPTHDAYETFIMMDGTLVVPGSLAEVGMLRKYKVVTAGKALADSTAIDFTNTGVAGMAYAPVLVGGGRDASGNLTINWTPVRRGSGGWPNGSNLPATDPENYQLEFFTDGTYTDDVRIVGVTVTTYTYTAADQTTDFGSPQNPVYVRIAQFAAIGGLGYFTRATI